MNYPAQLDAGAAGLAPRQTTEGGGKGGPVKPASKLASMRELGLLIIIAALCVGMSFASPYFLTWDNVRAMLLSFSIEGIVVVGMTCLLYTSPSPRDGLLSRMPSSA